MVICRAAHPRHARTHGAPRTPRTSAAAAPPLRASPHHSARATHSRSLLFLPPVVVAPSSLSRRTCAYVAARLRIAAAPAHARVRTRYFLRTRQLISDHGAHNAYRTRKWTWRHCKQAGDRRRSRWRLQSAADMLALQHSITQHRGVIARLRISEERFQRIVVRRDISYARAYRAPLRFRFASCACARRAHRCRRVINWRYRKWQHVKKRAGYSENAQHVQRSSGVQAAKTISGDFAAR